MVELVFLGGFHDAILSLDLDAVKISLYAVNID